jgi:hypothetical protein
MEIKRENVYCGYWVHDIIEDARKTYNDVLQHTNKTIAALAYALTNGKVKNRRERVNDTYFKEMYDVPNTVLFSFVIIMQILRIQKTMAQKCFQNIKKRMRILLKSS